MELYPQSLSVVSICHSMELAKEAQITSIQIRTMSVLLSWQFLKIAGTQIAMILSGKSEYPTTL